MLTNKEYLEEAVARFDYVIDSRGVTLEGRVFHFQPDFYQSSPVDPTSPGRSDKSGDDEYLGDFFKRNFPN